ncbi:hypothetical protein PR048_014215 [Dryococelus australis]|uniref:Retroviral polymerase SH3-like domain-containing protein n=1 Tax=Dryococelus australis TaxID=614101 RepID=A0ABQ9HDK3_9NEOP|nr:hypothetical protein PR048_014215 [Dryococelus australis]
MKSAVTWHRRMGHLTSLSAVCDTSSSYRDCDTCLKGKMKKTSFTHSVSRTSAVLDLAHSDVVGRMTPPSIGGTEYFVTFMDDYSKYSEGQILKKKSDVAKAFKQYESRVEIFQKKKNKGPSQTMEEGIKGYRLWRLSDKRIIVSRDVRFYEHVFPFKTLCPAKPLIHEQENVVEMRAVEERYEDEESEKLHPPDIRGSESVKRQLSEGDGKRPN